MRRIDDLDFPYLQRVLNIYVNLTKIPIITRAEMVAESTVEALPRTVKRVEETVQSV